MTFSKSVTNCSAGSPSLPCTATTVAGLTIEYVGPAGTNAKWPAGTELGEPTEAWVIDPARTEVRGPTRTEVKRPAVAEGGGNATLAPPTTALASKQLWTP
ncbi:hypothetical protein DAPPUDRAFT_115521 [Daphnia pulex]|uniref:Uncharacterized protein n=1 Tax=Daphnia pulex TaxID=6669 RepID=E9HLP1_DAPPU|nr:hypothetical protein DAPPUDRAFT_115521 [Daphnia pulex]|eukprot:EFX67341.1 hypothetical protein DAPPUDRAFT_115521 [Daphnia pulex]